LCLPGTRLEILDTILECISDGRSESTLWLCGPPGSGKTTIAATVADHFRNIARLGAYLSFGQSTRSSLTSSLVFRTIASQLASYSQALAVAIVRAIKQDPTILMDNNRRLFHDLVVEPLLSSVEGSTGPLLIILDGVDQWPS
ncbi:hypothetical protein B0H13DRAFT_1606430, partial [Mycena leptocephala]